MSQELFAEGAQQFWVNREKAKEKALK